MRVLVATAEFSPLMRTGGLGDAVAGLSGALVAAGVELTVALPRYRDLAGTGVASRVSVPGPAAGVRATTVGEVPVLLIDDPPAFDRPGTAYGPEPGTEFEDAWWRWARFALAVAELAEGYDLVHLHDAHVGAVALLTEVPTVFTVHNPAHPVLGPLAEAVELLDLDQATRTPGGPIEWYGRANYLKAGLVGADQATTVSPSFAVQLAGDPDESFGLGDVVGALPSPMVGILNGIDADSWDPGTDSRLPAPFRAGDLSGRAASRAMLARRAGLDEGMIFGNVGRVSAQKGFPLLDDAIDALVAEGFRFVMVGNGELDALIDGWARRHPRAVAHFEFDDDIARLTFAGTDAYLMPSAFEPSGLGQLYAMRYGAPPVARHTGGLADSVVDIDEEPALGNGLVFRPYEPAELAKSVRRAMRYRVAFPELWIEMQLRGMSTDWSWARRGGQYVALYERVRGESAVAT